jgi:hypothetical protein
LPNDSTESHLAAPEDGRTPGALQSSPTRAISRRQFISSATQAGLVASALTSLTLAGSRVRAATPRPGSRRKRIAILATEVRKHSHAQHFIDRFLEGYGWHGRHYHPQAELASIYVDQFPAGDLTHDRVRRHRVKLYPTVAEALTLGRSQLAVDGVLIIAEHGLYPRNERGQMLYPRHQFFQETMRVFEASGRAAPVFNDKHLSTDWQECVAMVAASKRLGFPFMSGSSLPVTWRIPAVEIPLGTPLAESVCVCYGGIDSYDIHGLETAQCMSERRAGGEVGIKSVLALRGTAVWNELAKREETRLLFFAALARSFTCKAPSGYTVGRPDLEWVRKNCPSPVAYFYEHLDGFRTTMLLANGLVGDFTYAGARKDTGEIFSCQMYLPMPPATSTQADFFNPLVNNIEQMILNGAATYPIERSWLCSGMLIAALDSLAQGQVLRPTPELRVAYQPAAASTYWRA